MDEKLSGPGEKRLQAVTKHESRYLFGSLRKISFYNSICRQTNPLNCLGNKASGVETRNKRFENCFRGLTKTIFSQAPKFSAFLNCTLQSHGSLFYVTEFGESLQVSGCFWKLCQTVSRAENRSAASTLLRFGHCEWHCEGIGCLFVCSTTSIPLQSCFPSIEQPFPSPFKGVRLFHPFNELSMKLLNWNSYSHSGKPMKIIEVACFLETPCTICQTTSVWCFTSNSFSLWSFVCSL